MSEDNQNRFRAYTEQGEVKIFGVIGDTTDLAPLRELPKGDLVFDCTDFKGVSWLGLINFNNFLLDYEGRIRLKNVSYTVYEYLRLLPECGREYDIISFETPLLADDPVKALSFSLDQPDSLLALVKDQNSEFIKKDQQFIYGTMSQMIGYVTEGLNLEANIPSPWGQENPDEGSFWFRLLGFWGSTIFLSLDLVRSQAVTLVELIEHIRTRAVMAESAFGRLDSKIDKHSDRLSDIGNEIREACKGIEDKIVNTYDKFRACQQQMQAKLCDGGTADNTAIMSLLDEAASIVISSESFLPIIETVGFELGGKLQIVRIVRICKDILSNTPDDQVDDEMLEAIREDMCIMDMLSEGDWDQTKELVEEELDEIASTIEKCIVVLQGFDLLRQVLEHRVLEGRLLSTARAQEDMLWLQVREDMFTQINRTLVTDQEKYSFFHYLPEGKKEEESNNAPPGDALFF